MKTCVYVDAYNLYYGSLHGTPYKWLDLGKLCSLLLPNDEIVRIRYCTAWIKAHPGKSGTELRQRTYVRALQTIPALSVHLGSYKQRVRRMKLARPPAAGDGMVQVVCSEEKGSDVNLASYMLLDAMRDECAQTVLISNDSDLTVPVELLKNDLNKRVIVYLPTTNPGRKPSVDLRRAASVARQLRAGPLMVSQFPETLADVHGTIHKPPEW